MKKLVIKTMLVLATFRVYGQGTLQFDQQVNPTTPPGVFQNIVPDPSGQSFVPSLSSIGFAQFDFTDANFNGLGTTMYVNIWSGSLATGTLLGTSQTVSMSDGFTGASTFLFTPITLAPGTTYYLQPIIQSGDSFEIGVGGLTYPNGQAFFEGNADPNLDIWFREGIVVPEPSILSLSVLGLVGFCVISRKRRFRVGQR